MPLYILNIHFQAAKSAEMADDKSKDLYGILPAQFTRLPLAQTDAQFASMDQLSETSPLVNQRVALRARLQTSRGTAKHAFIVLRSGVHCMQGIVSSDNAAVSKLMVKFAGSLNRESIVHVEGTLRTAEIKSEAITQRGIELDIDRLFAVHAAQKITPFAVEDAARAEEASGSATESEQALPRVLLETRLNNRIVDLRTATNQAIFRIQSGIGSLFREFFIQNEFVEIHSPKLISAASEGGANVFKVSYFKTEAFLAQSPQFYKQMAICGDLERVFEIAPVFRAENSFTHRHMTEFVGVDLEMTFQQHYHEVMLLIGRMFMFLFSELPRRFAPEIALVRKQYPIVEEFKLPHDGKFPIIQYPEAIAMLRAANVEIGDHDDMSTETEKLLGRIIKEKYNTDFYILDKFPLAIRPFYTMPDVDMPGYANAYDFFMRGEEIMSGAQRVHDPEMLVERAKAHGVDPISVEPYIDSFRFGAPPHAGGGIGLERVVMFYLGLKNIRMTSMFPRDPTRITP